MDIAPRPCTCVQGTKKPTTSTSAPATESKSAILAHIQLDTPWLWSLREALHVQREGGVGQTCIDAHVDVGTLSPATISTIIAVRAGQRHEARAELS